MGLALNQVIKVGSYVVKQQLKGVKRYPLVLMLEPLFKCNLACSGCGKIDYPDEILNQRLTPEQCLEAVDECGAPVVSIAGGEPLLHKEMPEIVRGIIARKKFVILCTNALLLDKRMDDYEPNPYFTWDIHLDGDKEMHDAAVDQKGVYDRAVKVLKKAKERGFRVCINTTLFNNADPERVAKFFDEVTAMGIRVGHPAVYLYGPLELSHKRIVGRALDNRHVANRSDIGVGDHHDDFQTFHRRAHRHSHHGALADRGIAHSLDTVPIGEAFQRMRRNVLTDHNQARFLAHGIFQRFSHRVAISQFGH